MRLREPCRRPPRKSNGGVCVCALDTELLGHHWFEGVQWLDAVLDESARQKLTLTTLDAALINHGDDASPAPEARGVSSWGEGGDLRTWSGPAVADLVWLARTAELEAARGARARQRQGAEGAARAAVERLGVSGHSRPRRRLPAGARGSARDGDRPGARNNQRTGRRASQSRPSAVRLGGLRDIGPRVVTPSGTSAAPRACGSVSLGSRRPRRYRGRRR